MFQRILVLAPHTDDGELGCGGSINKFIEENKEVYYVAFSIAEESVPLGFPKNALETEVKNATKVLGIPKSNLIIYNFPVRNFQSVRQEILEKLVKLSKEIYPDLIFMPSLNDLHQDHQTIAMEGLRAFKRKTVLGYEEPWNNITFNTTSFIQLEERHIEKKIQALECYETQKQRSYLTPDFIRSLAIARGTQIQESFAESFEVIRFIIK